MNAKKPPPKENDEQEELVAAIRKISSSVESLYNSGLNRRDVVTLIAHDTKIGRKSIESILDSIKLLEHNYTQG